MFECRHAGAIAPSWTSRHDVRLLVESVAEGGAPIVANRVAALLSKLFPFALDRDLPEVTAFLTAQIAGHAVVYSVILREAEHPFNRDGVERHFDYECPPLSH